TLTNDNEQLKAPENFYLTNAVTDSTVSMMNMHFKENKDKPFFFYVAYYAPHRPLQALQKDIQKYRGKFMNGWDENRKQRYERLRALKMIHSSCVLSDRDTKIPLWKDLSEDQKKIWDARMAVYAAQIDCMDQGIGKIISTLKENKELENTLIIFLSDNGGCAEGQGGNLDVEDLDFLGNESPEQSYRVNWANVSNTPFREYKHYVHEGGISTPLIAYWPSKIKKTGIITSQIGHVTDLMPTIIDIANASYPKTYNGNLLHPLTGTSLLPTIAHGKTFKHTPIFFEHEANRAVIDDEWKLVSKATEKPPYTGVWELYNLNTDRSEINNLILKYPKKAQMLETEWVEWAQRCNVFPLDNSNGKEKSKKDKGSPLLNK
ncbi:MAG: sulfatase-like hydrolase/transferase, partial [Bacteroidia bacterium]|nr:sulfatase-like hydrolase/transferase [Bacteroidia bacterium]